MFFRGVGNNPGKTLSFPNTSLKKGFNSSYLSTISNTLDHRVSLGANGGSSVFSQSLPLFLKLILSLTIKSVHLVRSSSYGSKNILTAKLKRWDAQPISGLIHKFDSDGTEGTTIEVRRLFTCSLHPSKIKANFSVSFAAIHFFEFFCDKSHVFF